jgi:hypothetical protein
MNRPTAALTQNEREIGRSAQMMARNWAAATTPMIRKMPAGLPPAIARPSIVGMRCRGRLIVHSM